MGIDGGDDEKMGALKGRVKVKMNWNWNWKLETRILVNGNGNENENGRVGIEMTRSRQGRKERIEIVRLLSF